MDSAKLTLLCEHGGCAAKVNAQVLDQIVNYWQGAGGHSVRLGLLEKDDVAAFDLGNEQVLLQSIDVITPIVDDGFTFGAIAVSHALSDIYAKGGTPLFALSFLGVSQNLAPSAIQEIIAGASDKLREAGVKVLGGHTISSSEPLVGFAVTGMVRKGHLVPLNGARAGNKLILTKAIGSGIISTAQKFFHLGVEDASLADMERAAAEASMLLLSNRVAEIMLKYHASACTDITGFGLAGHVSGMMKASGVGARISYWHVPVLPGVVRLFQRGIAPARLDENIKYYYGNDVVKTHDIDASWPVLFCPETSGGLLIAIDASQAERMVDALNSQEGTESALIGEVIEDAACMVTLTC